MLDLFYCNVLLASMCIKGAPLGNSDHNMLYIQPVYRRKLQQEKPENNLYYTVYNGGPRDTECKF